MTGTRMVWSLASVLALAGGPVSAAGPGPAPPMYGPPCYGPMPYLPPGYQQPAPGQPGQPLLPGQPGEAPAPAPADMFAQAPEAGGQAAETFNPNMFGDFLGPIACVNLPTGRFRRVVIPPSTPGGSSRIINVPITEKVRVPLVNRGNFKIADNGNPRPIDRVFVTYNYYNNAFGSINSPGVPRFDVHREVFGFEKTCFDGNASFSLRLPYNQSVGFIGVNDQDIGDLTFVTKFAFLNNLETGNVVSGGLAVTAPTGEETAALNELDFRSVLLQPWGGFLLNAGNAYVHGFSSLVVPTDSRDVTIWFNDLGVGYFVYRSNNCNSFLSAVAPTAEVHINTPLNHRGSESTPIGYVDSVNMTGGMIWVFRQRCFVGMGVAVPVTGPQPFDIEALASLNIRF